MTVCRIEIKALPNAPRTEAIGWLGEALKIKVHAPALEGKANQELCEFLAKSLNLPKRSVRILQGDTLRKKLVEISSLTHDQVVDRLFSKPGNP